MEKEKKERIKGLLVRDFPYLLLVGILLLCFLWLIHDTNNYKSQVERWAAEELQARGCLDPPLTSGYPGGNYQGPLNFTFKENTPSKWPTDYCVDRCDWNQTCYVDCIESEANI